MSGCLLMCLAVLAPRLFLMGSWLFTSWTAEAFEGRLWPLLGFFLMPYLTTAYLGTMVFNGGSFTGPWLFLVIVSVVFDVATQVDTESQS